MRNKIISALFLFVILNVINVHVYSQPRVSDSSKFSVITQSKVITEPVGWAYDTYTEKWCGHYGLCNPTYKKNSITPRKLSADFLSGANDEGIYSLQTKKIKMNDKIFYLLYHIYWDGEYDYPALEIGWRIYKTCKVWLITEEEYEKIRDLKTGINIVYLYDWTLSTHYPQKSSVDELNLRIIKLIKEAIQSGSPTKPNNEIKWYIKVEEDGNDIRFILPTHKQLWSEAERINRENELKKLENEYYFFVPILKYQCVSFEDEYFEVTKTIFDGFIIK